MDLRSAIDDLSRLADLTDGRVDPELTVAARRVIRRADERLRVGEQTVVALAGPTGAGKSTLFNAIAGTQIAVPGHRRPTTSQTLAVSFGATNAQLLDWLDIPRRHEVPAGEIRDLVMLDLPDHDSVQVAHHQEVQRLVKVVDQFIWVTDPQKYADASIHKRYLQPLAEHRGVITMVLSQVDRLSPEGLEACLKHLRQLLDADGLPGVQLFAASAKTGQGIHEIRDHIAKIAKQKSATAARLAADVRVMAHDFDQATRGGEGAAGLDRRQLEASLARAAGVPVVVDAVRKAMVHRGSLATGWPLTKWLVKLRPDPLKRLRLGGSKPELEAPGAAVTPRSSLQVRGSVGEAQLATALRDIAAAATEGMPLPWQQAARQAVDSRAATLPDALDKVLVQTNLGTEKSPVWWQILRGLQWLLIVAMVVGAGWLLVNLVLTYLGMPALPRVPLFANGTFAGVPLPTVLLVGGAISGVVLSALSRVFVGLGAKSAARKADKALRAGIAQVAETEVVTPLEHELQRYDETRRLVRRLA